MRFIPAERLTYRSPLDAETILSRLAGAIEPPKLLRLNKKAPHKPYEGAIQGRTFRMNRVIHYRNSFLPRIRGTVEATGVACTVAVRMDLHPLVWVFLAIWMGVIGVISVLLLLETIPSNGFDPVLLILPVMLFFAYGMALGGFKYESKKSRQFLAELLEAEAAEASR